MTALAVCEVHPAPFTHLPAPREQQLHHVIPRDWQRGGWAPPVAPFPGVYDAFGVHEQLWDSRGIDVPPTCHLNVHTWIVAVMRRLAFLKLAAAPVEADIRAAGQVVGGAAAIFSPRSGKVGAGARAELEWAMQAPIRYTQAGGDVRTLIAAGQWGAS